MFMRVYVCACVYVCVPVQLCACINKRTVFKNILLSHGTWGWNPGSPSLMAIDFFWALGCRKGKQAQSSAILACIASWWLRQSAILCILVLVLLASLRRNKHAFFSAEDKIPGRGVAGPAQFN